MASSLGPRRELQCSQMTSTSQGPHGRDALAEIIRYNSRFIGDGRDPGWLRSKLDRLCASPFGFLRGTFHLFVADWPIFGHDPLADGATQPIVGDLHLENFGAYRAADSTIVFDVNDFDETGVGTPARSSGSVALSMPGEPLPVRSIFAPLRHAIRRTRSAS